MKAFPFEGSFLVILTLLLTCQFKEDVVTCAPLSVVTGGQTSPFTKGKTEVGSWYYAFIATE